MSRSPRLVSRPIAALAALTLALSGLGVAISPAAAEPIDAPDREVVNLNTNWVAEAPEGMRAVDFPEDTARLDRDAPQVSPAASPIVTGVLEFRTLDGGTEPVTSGLVRFWREMSPDYFEMTNEISSFGVNGEFSRSVLAGVYRIEFITFDVSFGARTYWNNEAVFFTADELTLNDDMGQDLGTVVIEPRYLNHTRIAGEDRFETAAALTAGMFDGTTRAPVIYVADGLSFADALSAGPAAAAQGGALLPVRTTSIPDVIKDELTRLNPERIVIAGGVGAVSAAVEAELRTYVDSPDDVERVAGPDRYATSRAIVLDAFGESGLQSIFFATGRDFPDALAAGPAAAHFGGAVLLVDGALTTLPLATQTLISSFDEPYAFLVGGEGVIRPQIEQAINTAIGAEEPALRLWGENRIETANAINDRVFDQTGTYPDFAFLANSNGFADALAAGPVAAAFQAPLYLTTQPCMDAQAFYDIVGLLVSQIFPVGGTGVLSDNVIDGPLC